MTAIRSVRAAEGKFVQIANEAAQDRRLSLKARGILLYALSLPPDSTFSASWLEAQVPEGRESVRTGLAELERYGYFRRTKKQDKLGHWVWDQVISDAPLTEETADEVTSSEPDSSICGFPADGHPADGKPSDKELKTEDLKTKEDQSARAREAAPPVDNSAQMIEMILFELEDLTGQVVTVGHARLVESQVVGRHKGKHGPSSAPNDPIRYVRTAIRRNPGSFPPTQTPPPYRAPVGRPVGRQARNDPEREQLAEPVNIGSMISQFALAQGRKHEVA